MNKPSQFVSALMTLALGILFVILKGDVIGIAITVLGIALLISAIIDFIKKNVTAGVIKAVLGVAVLVASPVRQRRGLSLPCRRASVRGSPME